MSNPAKAHAEYSASGAPRWTVCFGSIRLSKKAPPKKSSTWADEGTDAHKILEAGIKAYIEGGKPYVAMMKAAEEFKKTWGTAKAEEAHFHVKDSYKTILEKIPEGAEVISETKVDASAFTKEGQFGTIDCGIIEHFGTLTVIDFKYGAGIPIDPHENAQLVYYALGLLELYGYDFAKVRIIVIQPRARGETVKTWETDIATMKRWADKFRAAVRECEKPDAKLVPYDRRVHKENHCRFCQAAVICPALRNKGISDLKGDFDDTTGSVALPVTVKGTVTVKNLGAMLTACSRVETWIRAVRAFALNELKNGGSVEGYKLVAKKSRRKWIDAERARKLAATQFGEQAFTEPEMVSPAQLEKISIEAKEFVKKHSTSVSSGCTIAPASDRRPAYDTFANDFAELTDETEGEEDEYGQEE